MFRSLSLSIVTIGLFLSFGNKRLSCRIASNQIGVFFKRRNGSIEFTMFEKSIAQTKAERSCVRGVGHSPPHSASDDDAVPLSPRLFRIIERFSFLLCWYYVRNLFCIPRRFNSRLPFSPFAASAMHSSPKLYMYDNEGSPPVRLSPDRRSLRRIRLSVVERIKIFTSFDFPLSIGFSLKGDQAATAISMETTNRNKF